MKKMIGALLVLLLFVTEISGLSAYASEIDDELGEVVMIAVPDGNGKLNTLVMLLKKLMLRLHGNLI